MDEQNNFPKGSEWRKWNLHIHTPASYTYQSSNTNEEDEYKQIIKTINESDIDVFAVTDYWTFDGYLKLIDINDKLLEEEQLKKVVFPGIELRFDIIDDEDKRRINFQVIVDNKGTRQEVKNRIDEFFNKLRLSSQDKNITKQNFIDIAREYSDDILQKLVGKKNNECTEEDFYRAGLECCFVSYDNIREVLKTPVIKASVFFICPWDKYGGISKIDSVLRTDIQKQLVHLAGAIESANEDTIKLFLLDPDFLKEKSFKTSWLQFLKETPKPCVCGSDAKSVREIAQFPNERACWIKADPTFYGLKQIIHEPLDRVYIGEIPPKLQDIDDNKSKYIDSISIDHSDTNTRYKWFSNTLPLNPGLICVIGRKGSGKSALADIISLLGGSHQKKLFSFLRSDKFLKLPDSKEYNAVAHWHDGEGSNSSLAAEVDLLTEQERIKYLPQEYVETICNEEGVSTKFQDEINKLVFSYVPPTDRAGAADIQELINRKTSPIDQQILRFRNVVSNKSSELIALENKGRADYLESLAKKKEELERELNALPVPKEVPKPSKDLDPGLQKEMEKLEGELQKIDETIEQKLGELTKINIDSELLSTVERELSDFSKSYADLKEKFEVDLKSLGINFDSLIKFELDIIDITKSKKQLSAQKTKLQRTFGLIDKEESDTTETLPDQKSKLEKQIKEINKKLDSENKAYQGYLKKKKEYDTRRKALIGQSSDRGLTSIKSIEYEIEYVKNHLANDIGNCVQELKKTSEQIYHELDQKKKIFEEIYKPLKDDQKRKLGFSSNDINFDVGIIFDKKKFPDQFLKHINQAKDGSFQGIEEGKGVLKSLVDQYTYKGLGDVINFVDNVLSALKKDITQDPHVEKDFDEQMLNKDSKKQVYELLYGLGYLGVQYRLLFDNKDLNENIFSPGEKGAILLIFYLLFDKDKTPLVIDQPEENLDNESVYDLLVPYIKKAKEHRQIIIVTHNPNIAVVCDADQIIHAEMNKETSEIRYQSGSIEDPKTNKSIVRVLEGTLPAFSKRDSKYIKDRIA